MAEQTPENIKEVRQIIAPAGAQVLPNYLKIGDKLAKTFFVFSYPRYLATGWFEPLINLPNLFDISIFVSPIDTGTALKNLRKKAGQLEAEMNDEQEKGLVRNPQLETAIQDVETLRDQLQQSEEKLFDTGVYITIYADNEDDLSAPREQAGHHDGGEADLSEAGAF
jgi:conjugal transfer ATP-binding protein TraC